MNRSPYDDMTHAVPSMEILEDRSISMEAAVIYLFLLAGPLVGMQWLSYVVVWGWSDLRQGLDALLTFRIGGPIFVLGIASHEMIHGLSWKFAGSLPWKAIKFGFQLKSFTPYAHLHVPVTARTYRIGTVMPLMVLGIFPFMLSLSLGMAHLAAFGMIFTLVAGGDLAIVWLLRGVPATAWIKDHDSRAGCYVLKLL